MNPLEQLIAQLSQQAGPRGFTYAGRVGQPGMSMGDLLTQPSLINDTETGGVNTGMLGNTLGSNILSMVRASNPSGYLPQPAQVVNRANVDQAKILAFLRNTLGGMLPTSIMQGQQ